MLYNPELYKEPSFSDMADFCDSKDPKETYVWENSHNCACAQYSHTKGMKSNTWLNANNADSVVWGRLNNIAGQGSRTFGELAKRLRVDA